MGSKNSAMRIACFVILFTATLALMCSTLSHAEDPGNVMKRKQEGYGKQKNKKPQEKQYDPTLKIYLTSKKAVYEPGETPVIDVYLQNNGKDTRYFKRIWTTNKKEGVYFQIFTDDKATTGTGIVKKESHPPESAETADAMRLDPGEKEKIMTLTVLTVLEGEHALRVEYGADYRVVEPQPRNWWSGLSESNRLTFNAKRILDENKISAAADKVIKAIHKDIMGIVSEYPSIAAYNNDAFENGTGENGGVGRIQFRVMRPKLREIKIYFEKPDFQPRTLVMYERPFPYLNTKLFAHIDTGDESRLRSKLLGIIRTREKLLYETTRELASDVRIEISPFGPKLSKKLRRAGYIILGEIKSKKVEDSKPGEYKIRKWILDVHIDKVYEGKILSKDIYVKSGALPAFFGDEDIIGKEYIMLFAEKSNWQAEYSLIGVEDARDNLKEWLQIKYFSGK